MNKTLLQELIEWGDELRRELDQEGHKAGDFVSEVVAALRDAEPAVRGWIRLNPSWISDEERAVLKRLGGPDA